MYVIQHKRQLERIREMITLRKNDQTLEVFYHDPKTGELWKSFFPKRTESDSGPKLLRPDPLPESLEIQLDLCLNSNVNADGILNPTQAFKDIEINQKPIHISKPELLMLSKRAKLLKLKRLFWF